MSLFSKHEPHWRRLSVPSRTERLGAGLRLRRCALPLPHISGSGQTLAFFSDLHWDGRHGQRVDALVRAINLADPEWLVFGGDLIRYLSDLPAALEILGRLSARRGKFAVLGNRERVHTWLSDQFWIDAYAKVGFTCLINQTCQPAGAENPIFVGLDDPRHGAPRADLCMPFLGTARPLCLLTHSPDAMGLLRHRFAGHLVLAGHTHGGQLRLPFWGPLYTSSRHGRQFDRGWLVRDDGVRMCVTAGVGETGLRVLRRRLNCPAEVCLISLSTHDISTTVRITPADSDVSS